MSVVMDSDTLIDLYTKPGSRVAAKIAIILEELGYVITVARSF